MLMGLRVLVGGTGVGDGLVGDAWGSGGQDAENVWAHGGDGGAQTRKERSVRRKISLNRGLRPMKEAAWSRASRVQEVEGGALSA